MSETLIIFVGFCLGYLSGSIPFGLIFTKRAGLGDVRTIGSGNIGATNVLRTGNKMVALATLIADAAKGVIPILLLRAWIEGDTTALWTSYAAALGTFLGHVFPVWLKFHGGKGISVFIGVLFALNLQAGLIFIASWLVTAWLFRMSSLAGLVACASVPVSMIIMQDLPLAALTLALAAISFWAHRSNISRLLKGEEPRFSKK